LLAHSVARSFGDRVRFISEGYGDSKLAAQNGVSRYPAIFVDDILVATPNDFGFYGKGEKKEGGRYAPLKRAESHDRFRRDLSRMIELIIAGKKEQARAEATPAPEPELESFPDVKIVDLDGKTWSRAELAGGVVLVELWATWCLPCGATLRWLGEVEKRYGARVTILALAVESEESSVKKFANQLAQPLIFGMGTPAIARAFGDVSAVPMLFLFDRQGRAAGVFFGAPPTLRRDVEAKLETLIAP
jgi:thiol-disulfide isomerase/thioredoxin